MHRAAKFGVFCCVLTPFRRLDTIRAEKEIAQEPGELIYGPRRHTASSLQRVDFHHARLKMIIFSRLVTVRTVAKSGSMYR